MNMSRNKMAKVSITEVALVLLIVALGFGVLAALKARSRNAMPPTTIAVPAVEKVFLPEVVPQKFLMETSSYPDFGGSTFRYEQSRGVLHYSSSEGSSERREIEVTVSEDALIQFVKALNRAEFGNWEKTYDGELMDGWWWRVEVWTQNRLFRSSGENATPPQYSQVVSAFHALMNSATETTSIMWNPNVSQESGAASKTNHPAESTVATNRH